MVTVLHRWILALVLHVLIHAYTISINFTVLCPHFVQVFVTYVMFLTIFTCKAFITWISLKRKFICTQQRSFFCNKLHCLEYKIQLVTTNFLVKWIQILVSLSKYMYVLCIFASQANAVLLTEHMLFGKCSRTSEWWIHLDSSIWCSWRGCRLWGVEMY